MYIISFNPRRVKLFPVYILKKTITEILNDLPKTAQLMPKGVNIKTQIYLISKLSF